MDRNDRRCFGVNQNSKNRPFNSGRLIIQKIIWSHITPRLENNPDTGRRKEQGEKDKQTNSTQIFDRLMQRE
jgi:hypothetical protein